MMELKKVGWSVMINKKNLFTVLSALSWIAFSYAEEEALDGPEAAASIVEAGPSGEVKSTPASPETSSSAESESATSGDAEEEPSLDESEDAVPSGEDFFVVDPPSDLSAPDAPDTTAEKKD